MKKFHRISDFETTRPWCARVTVKYSLFGRPAHTITERFATEDELRDWLRAFPRRDVVLAGYQTRGYAGTAIWFGRQPRRIKSVIQPLAGFGSVEPEISREDFILRERGGQTGLISRVDLILGAVTVLACGNPLSRDAAEFEAINDPGAHLAFEKGEVTAVSRDKLLDEAASWVDKTYSGEFVVVGPSQALEPLLLSRNS